MPKTINVKLKDADGKQYVWKVSRVPRAINCTTGKTHIISGWEYTDHEGYVRFSEGNWLELVSNLRARAGCYGLTANVS